MTAIRRSVAAQEGDSANAGILRLIGLRLPVSLLAVLRLRTILLRSMRLPVLRLLARTVTVTPALLAAVSIAIVTARRSLGGRLLGALRMRAPIAHW